MATFLGRGGSAPTNPAPFWTESSGASRSSSPLGKTIKPAGVPGAFDERSMSSTTHKARSPGLADVVATLYEESKGERRKIIPGYTGYIPHTGEIAGRNQVKAAARAMAHTAEELAVKDSLPSDPVHKESLVRVESAYTTHILGKDMSATLVGRNEAMPKHIPGYTGHVPGIQECALGLSYGQITSETLRGHSMNPKEGRRALIEAGAGFDARGTTPGYPYLKPRPKPSLECNDPSLYLHYTGK